MPRCSHVILAAIALTALLGGCKREAPKPATVQGAPTMGPPSGDVIEQENRSKLLANLYDLQPLSNGTVFIDDQNEPWARQANGLMTHDLLPSNDGQPPQLGQKVTLSYVGTYPDTKKIFDQSRKDKPLTFTMGSKDLIKGLSLGIQGMHVGGTRRIYVPADLAYGERGDPMRNIPGNQPLIFEVELLSVTGTAISISVGDLPKMDPLGPPNLLLMPPSRTTKPAATQPEPTTTVPAPAEAGPQPAPPK